MNWEEYKQQQRLDRRARYVMWLIGAGTVVVCIGIWWGVRSLARASGFGPSVEMSDIP